MKVQQKKDKAKMETHKPDPGDGIEVEVPMVCKNSTKMNVVIGIELDKLNQQEERKTENEPTRPEADISDSNALDKSDFEMEVVLKTPAKRVTNFLKHNNSSKVGKKKNAPNQIWTLDVAPGRVVQGYVEVELEQKRETLTIYLVKVRVQKYLQYKDGKENGLERLVKYQCTARNLSILYIPRGI
ncbi:hypothetical protein F8M41_003062 [Gigaspora margarita]|uniref:Uncharacterized protein n=1 Tax=Gigaspora margarita TaxID=4874 RepID=A0A8H3XD91_GIGMA|nr:hypothetical protein F8M41_003062 [Gigaspora margarita]